MYIRLIEGEWIEYVHIPLITDKYFKSGLFSIKEDMRDLGYLNRNNEIILDENHSLAGFWSNFKFYFKDEILNLILKKIEVN